MQAAGENMQWETVRKIYRKMVRYYKFEAAFPLEESLAAVRKRRGGDMTYRKSFHKAPPGEWRRGACDIEVRPDAFKKHCADTNSRPTRNSLDRFVSTES